MAHLRTALIAALTGLLSGTAHASTVGFGPELIRPDDPLLADVRWLVARSELPLHFSTLQPVTRIRLAEAWIQDSLAAIPSHAGVRLARELAAEIQALGGRTAFREVPPAFETPLAGGRLRIRPYAQLDAVWKDERGLLWGPSPRLGLEGTLHFSEHFALHEDLFAGDVEGGRRWGDALIADTDFLIFLEQAYFGYEGPHGSALLGRTRHSWGPGGSNLLLGRGAAPFDQLAYELHSGPWRWRALTGVLQHNEEKNVAAHRLEWTPTPRWSVSISEGAIFQGNPAQLLYALGVVPYAVIERVQGSDAVTGPAIDRVRNNVLYAMDITHRARAPLLVWASILVDDVGTETSDLPSRLGYQVGAEFAPRHAGVDWRFGIEASKVFNYVYSVYYANSDWSHQGDPLGHDAGPDFESVLLRVGVRPRVAWGADLELAWARHGEGRIGVPWYPPSDPRMEGNVSNSAGTLSGVVEERLGLTCGVQFDPSAAISARTELALQSIRDFDHRPGADETEASWRLLVRVHR